MATFLVLPDFDDAELVPMARKVLKMCLRGAIDPRVGEIQRKTALDLLQAGILEHLTDEQLELEFRRIEVEIERRAQARAKEKP